MQALKTTRRRAVAAALALSLGLGGFTYAPAVLASPGTVSGPEVAQAAIGWGGVCKTTRVRTGSWGNWWIYTTTTYRWWTTSLTGTTCQPYSTSRDYVWKGW